MQRSTNNRRQKSSNQQDAMMGNRGRLDDQNDLSADRQAEEEGTETSTSVIIIYLVDEASSPWSSYRIGGLVRICRHGDGVSSRTTVTSIVAAQYQSWNLSHEEGMNNERPLRRQVFPRHHSMVPLSPMVKTTRRNMSIYHLSRGSHEPNSNLLCICIVSN